ncbi:MAG: nickel pincer cofactor biosynthesis protein LarC [Clostridia bacterium]|nr:nickel pincer cofactor biosynthesis protein LarC [Clostridia bacterium]
MKTLYLECGMGAAGDMLMAALLELVPDRQAFVDRMNALFAPRIHLEAEPAVKCGITGTHMHVVIDGVEEESEDDHDHEHHHHHDHDDEHGHDHEHHHHHDHDDEHEHEHHHHDHDDEHDHDHEHPHHHDHDEHDHDHEHDEHDHGHHHGHHHHSSLQDIHDLINALDIPEKVKEDARAVYGIIADAESQVHGHPVSEIHFHEVGTLDAVVDVVGVCLLMDILSPQQVFASPVLVGSGYVRCMHGVLPVPAPATALILKGIPTYGGKVQGELCTPTGAALLRHFVQHFGDRPVMATASIGYGMGMKDFERANCVRAFLGESEGVREEITRLECNLDDMSGEEIGFAMDQLLKAGARDVYTQAIGMKKSRPGTLLSVICLPEDADRLAGILMQHTTTLGIRRQDMNRYVLSREITTADTPYGPVRIKTSSGMGVKKAKPEYDDLAAIAEKTGLSIREIREQLK